MPILFEKILAVLVLPLSVSLILGLAAVAWLAVGRRSLARLGLALALGILWLFSTPVIARALTASLENQSAPTGGREKADVAIVLGGMMSSVKPGRSEPSISSAADRAVHAARLFRAGRVLYLLITGGNLPWQQAQQPEADQVACLLQEWGIPREWIILENQSRTTFENAAHSKPLWDAHGFSSGLLVTSAFHMPRALAVFRRAGFTVIPAPADFRGGAPLEGGVLALLPDAAALETSTIALREWLGLTVYRLRGWA